MFLLVFWRVGWFFYVCFQLFVHLLYTFFAGFWRFSLVLGWFSIFLFVSGSKALAIAILGWKKKVFRIWKALNRCLPRFWASTGSSLQAAVDPKHPVSKRTCDSLRYWKKRKKNLSITLVHEFSIATKPPVSPSLAQTPGYSSGDVKLKTKAGLRGSPSRSGGKRNLGSQKALASACAKPPCWCLFLVD